MKVLFLDVDGVLNSEQSAGWKHYEWVKAGSILPRDEKTFNFNPVETNNLRRLMEDVPDMQIVLSSCWRIGRDTKGCQDLLTEHGLMGARVEGRTGQSYNGDNGGRGREIQEWLDQHPEVTKFVILDDDSDMGHLKPYLVQTNFRIGLTLLHNDKIKEMLQ